MFSSGEVVPECNRSSCHERVHGSSQNWLKPNTSSFQLHIYCTDLNILCSRESNITFMCACVYVMACMDYEELVMKWILE